MPIKVRSPTAYTWHSNLEWIKPTSRVIIVGGFTMFLIIFQWRCNLCENYDQKCPKNVHKGYFCPWILFRAWRIAIHPRLNNNILRMSVNRCRRKVVHEKKMAFVLSRAGGHKISTEHSDSANLRHQGRWSRNIHCGAGGRAYYTENAKKILLKFWIRIVTPNQHWKRMIRC